MTRRLLRRYGAVPHAIVANSLSVATDVTAWWPSGCVDLFA